MLAECVVNVSEGRDLGTVRAVASAGQHALLDVHTDAEHNRSVITLGGTTDEVQDAVQAVVAEAVLRIDLRDHQGVHPRLGAADVVPFVALPAPTGAAGTTPRAAPAAGTPVAASQRGAAPLTWAVAARDRFARWAATRLDLPCFLYGPERTLPDVRRLAFTPLPPDVGPPMPHPTAGASAVGARGVLIAYNVSVAARADGHEEQPDRARARELARLVATQIRRPAVRSLGLAVGPGAQVSCNLVDPSSVGIAELYDSVVGVVEAEGGAVLGAELVGLVPGPVLHQVPRHRWAELDLGEDRTIEARLAQPGLGNLPG